MGYLLPTDAKIRVQKDTNLDVRVEYEPGIAVLVVEGPPSDENRFVFKLATNQSAPRKFFDEASVKRFIDVLKVMTTPYVVRFGP